MKTKKLSTILSLGVVVLMTLSLLGVAGVGAQEGGPPVLPCIFYGNVTIDGNPAPVGTEIIAKIEDRTCGNITVAEAGKYGRAAGVKLLVKGTAEDENKILSFYVDGAKAAETATWHSGEIYNLDLSVVKEAGPGPTISPSPTPTAGPGGAGAGAMPVAVMIGIVGVVAAALILLGLKMRKS